MGWSKMECNRTGITATPANVANIMREFLQYIRFTAMSLEDFIIHVSKTDVLSLEVVGRKRKIILITLFISTYISFFFAATRSSLANSHQNICWK